MSCDRTPGRITQARRGLLQEHISARVDHNINMRGIAYARDYSSLRKKTLNEGASPLLIQYLLLLKTMIPNSQLIFLPSAKRGLGKN